MRIATDIDWDYDDDDEQDLPTEVEIPNDVEDDEIADYLSDEYGFCVRSFCI
jgi:hypothetical protein